MIIPVKCFSCGNVIADKYRYYLEEVRKIKMCNVTSGDPIDIEKVIYLTKENHEKAPEGQVLDNLGMTRMCCRRHFLTHVDIE
jgi:DNA-directed RNA polymerase I, II, and III subunit RPABC5